MEALAAVATERQTFFPQLELVEPDVLSEVSVIPEMAEDELVRARADRFIAAVAIGGWDADMAAPEIKKVKPIESLYEAVQAAAIGDETARKMVETNAATDVIERTMKTGHVIKVELDVDEAGKIQQHGQTLDSVQANSLRFAADSPQMRERVEVETTNAFRIEQAYRNGELEDHSFVVISLAADNMTKNEMDEAGFFTETMTCAIQVTTSSGKTLTTESAFVSGVKQPGGERHDLQTVVELGRGLNIDLAGKTGAEIINTPIKIPNSVIPNGVIDLVKRWDEPNGTFFGEAKPQQDYLEYLEVCKEREARFQPKVETIVRDLIAEASTIKNPLQAVLRLHKISEKHMVIQAIGDTDINPLVFGPAAPHIIAARLALETGNYDQVATQSSLAIRNANSSSCPGAAKSPNETDNNSSSSDNDEDCEFISKSCPMCGAKNVKTKVTRHQISGSCGCKKSK